MECHVDAGTRFAYFRQVFVCKGRTLSINRSELDLVNILDLLKQLGLSNAKHWDNISPLTQIFKSPGGLLLYPRESKITGRSA